MKVKGTYYGDLDGTEVYVNGNIDGISTDELLKYVHYIRNKENIDNKKMMLASLTVELTKDKQIALDYSIKPRKFERIRRITGYLVGDLSKWNNGKLAEEHDRVKHSIA